MKVTFNRAKAHRLMSKTICSVMIAMTIISFNSCEKDDDENLKKVDGQGLTEDIHNFVPDDILEKLKDLGIKIHGGNTPPQIEGRYFVSTLPYVKQNFFGNLAWQNNMYLTFSEQNSTNLTVKLDYTMDSQNGNIVASGMGAFIIGDGNNFSVFVEVTKSLDSNSMATTVEVHSGEIEANGIKNYQRATIMVDNHGNPDKTWLDNGQGVLQEDGDGFSKKTN